MFYVLDRTAVDGSGAMERGDTIISFPVLCCNNATINRRPDTQQTCFREIYSSLQACGDEAH
jgi:hypothetical protein